MTEDVARDSRKSLVGDAYERGRFPGIVAVATERGDVRWRHAVGETGTAYRIASITKTFTAVAVMQLRDGGRLDLDDPLGRHLTGAPYAGSTVRRLLAHSTGMTAEPAGPWWERVPGGSWEQLVSANSDELVFRPGERYHYSNLAYALLGRLVTELRGVAWWEVLTEHILDPLGLTGTTFDRPDGAAAGTSRDPVTDALVREPAEDQGAMAPAGQLWSTVDDLARWADVLAVGHPGVLEATTAVEMRTVQSGDPETQHRGAYGLGLRLHWTPTGTLLGHTGSLPGYLAGMFVDPLSRIGSIVLTNGTTGLDPEGLCAALVEATRSNRPAGQVAAGPLPVDGESPAADLAGAWYWGNTAFELLPTDAGFVLVDGESRTRFRREGADTYRGENGYLAGERLDVHRRGDGSPGHLLAATFLFTRTPYDPEAPIPGELPVPLR